MRTRIKIGGMTVSPQLPDANCAPGLEPCGARFSRGFTLIEVMIAAGILFMCLFAILALLANTLKNARSLQHRKVDAGMVAAELSLTNKVAEGPDSGDFGDVYPDYSWTSDAYEVSSNGLYQVDLTVERSPGRVKESQMSILLFRPESQRGGAPPPRR